MSLWTTYFFIWSSRVVRPASCLMGSPWHGCQSLISCQSHHCHPRHKDRNGQTEMLCYLFANSIACDVVIYPCQSSKRYDFSYHPWRWIRIFVSLLKVSDEILSACLQFLVNKRHGFLKLICIGKMGSICQPKHIISSDGDEYSLLYFIK